MQLSALLGRPCYCAFLFIKYPSVALLGTQIIKVNTLPSSWLKYKQLNTLLCNHFLMKHQNTYKVKNQTKSHIPTSCPSTLITFLLCCPPFFSPPSGVRLPMGIHRNPKATHNPARMGVNSGVCKPHSQSLQSPHTVATRWKDRKKLEGYGQVSSCTRQFPFCLFPTSAKKLGIWHQGGKDSSQSQQTPSQYDYNFNLLNWWWKLIRNKISNLEVIYLPTFSLNSKFRLPSGQLHNLYF